MSTTPLSTGRQGTPALVAFAALPIAHVAAAADVSRPTIYRWIGQTDDN